jgi:hypothetical protein
MRWQGQCAAIRCCGCRRRIRAGKCGDHAVKAVRFHEYGGIDAEFVVLNDVALT